jgi:ADP-heptose:LPS heptosyltransferase
MIHNLKRTELLSIPNKYPILIKILEAVLLVFFKVIRKLTPNRKTGNNIILSFHRLGDSVFTIPALMGLFNRYATKDFILFCFPETRVIYEKVFPNLKIFTVSLSDYLFEGRIADLKIRKLFAEQEPYDIIDLTGTVNSVSLFLGQKVNRVFGLSDDLLKHAYDDYSLKTNVPHLTDLYINCVNLYKEMNLCKYEKEFQSNYITTGKILIHPFAGWEAKEWGIIKFIELAKKLKSEFEVEFVFPTSSRNDDLKKLLIDEKINFCESKSVEDFVELLRKVSLLISNDSGPVHIASLFGKPTFTIFGPTNPVNHVPYGEIHKYIRKEIHCTPYDTKYCFTRGGEFCDTYECMRSLDVQEVYDSVKQFLISLNIKNKL